MISAYFSYTVLYMLSFCIGMSADDRLHALRDPCKNRSEDKGDICKDSVGGKHLYFRST